MEIESKIIEVDFNETNEKLEKIWAVIDFFKREFKAVWVENNQWYKYRIRKEWEKVIEEHKEIILSEDWTKKAIETPKVVENFEDAKLFAKKIWFLETSFSVKNRTQYILNLSENREAKIVIDEYSNLDWMEIPALLEIEVELAEENEVEEKRALETIKEIAELLGFKEKDLKKWTAKELADYYRK